MLLLPWGPSVGVCGVRLRAGWTRPGGWRSERAEKHRERQALRRLSGSSNSGESKVSDICSVHLQVQSSAAQPIHTQYRDLVLRFKMSRSVFSIDPTVSSPCFCFVLCFMQNGAGTDIHAVWEHYFHYPLLKTFGASTSNNTMNKETKTSHK